MQRGQRGARTSPAGSDQSAKKGSAVSSTLKILVVDDNPTILKLICHSLERCGELLTADDGADRGDRADSVGRFCADHDYSLVSPAAYQQFAVTIALSVLISAFNALSRSPALAALTLRPRKKGGGPRQILTTGSTWRTRASRTETSDRPPSRSAKRP